MQSEAMNESFKIMEQNSNLGWHVIVLSSVTLVIVLLMACCKINYLKHFFL